MTQFPFIELVEQHLHPGVEYVIKKRLEMMKEGEMDPNVLEVISKQYSAQGALGMQDVSQLELDHIPIEQLRGQMGWDNVDITTTKIHVRDQLIDGQYGKILIRLYCPDTSLLLPAIIYFHGGGFFGGTIKVTDNVCKALAERANAVVISIDYPLAPEHPFPIGLTDCFGAIQWIYRHAKEYDIDPSKIAVAGDSAGGNLATVCAMMDRDFNLGMIRYQALIYPTVNLANATTDDYEWSLDRYTISDHHRPFIIAGLEGMRKSLPLVKKLYLRNREDPTHPYISPLLCEDLSGMPETIIFTAEFDYLRLEAEAYARKLAKFGVKTKMIQYQGMDHAFIDKIGIYPQAEDCINEIANGVKRVFYQA